MKLQKSLIRVIRLFAPLGRIARNVSAIWFWIALSIFVNISSVTHGDEFYVANYGNSTIVKFDSAGTPSLFFSVPDYPPVGVALDNHGNVFVNTIGNTMWKVDSGGHGALFTSAGLNQPHGMAFDRNGLLYVANSGNNSIERYDTSGNASVYVGAGILYSPIGLGFDGGGNLFVANYYTHGYVEKFDPQGRASFFSAQVNACYGLAIDSHDSVYVGSGYAIQGTWSVYKFDSEGHASVFATFQVMPTGLLFDSSDNLYVALGNNTIQRVDAQGTVSLFANTGLSYPYFMAVEIPEPSLFGLVSVCAMSLLIARRRR